MAVGILATKGEIDSRMGDIARGLQKVFKEHSILKGYLDANTEAALVALGYTAQDVAVLKSASADLQQLFDITYGRANLAAAKDFTTFLRQLWGVGAQ